MKLEVREKLAQKLLNKSKKEIVISAKWQIRKLWALLPLQRH